MTNTDKSLAARRANAQKAHAALANRRKEDPEWFATTMRANARKAQEALAKLRKEKSECAALLQKAHEAVAQRRKEDPEFDAKLRGGLEKGQAILAELRKDPGWAAKERERLKKARERFRKARAEKDELRRKEIKARRSAAIKAARGQPARDRRRAIRRGEDPEVQS